MPRTKTTHQTPTQLGKEVAQQVLAFKTATNAYAKECIELGIPSAVIQKDRVLYEQSVFALKLLEKGIA